MRSKSIKPVITLTSILATLAMILTFIITPNATAAETTASATTSVSSSATVNSLTTSNVRRIEQSLTPGEHAFLGTVNGYDLYMQKDAAGTSSLLAVPLGVEPEVSGTAQSRSACVAAVTAALYALGAAVIAIAAETGGLEIAGVFLGPEVLNLIADAFGSVAAVEEIVAQFVC